MDFHYLSFPFQRTWPQANPDEAGCNLWVQYLHGRCRERLGSRVWQWPRRPDWPLHDRQTAWWYCGNSIENPEGTFLQLNKIHWSPVLNEPRIKKENSHQSLGKEKLQCATVFHEPTDATKANWIVESRKLLKALRRDDVNGSVKIVTAEEKWYYWCYNHSS
jgi:hypothetical protein